MKFSHLFINCLKKEPLSQNPGSAPGGLFDGPRQCKLNSLWPIIRYPGEGAMIFLVARYLFYIRRQQIYLFSSISQPRYFICLKAEPGYFFTRMKTYMFKNQSTFSSTDMLSKDLSHNTSINLFEIIAMQCVNVLFNFIFNYHDTMLDHYTDFNI